jgi:hypothetical protein
MGNAQPQAVAFTDRKSIIKAHCLERKPNFDDEVATLVKQLPFLERTPREGKGPRDVSSTPLALLERCLFGTGLIRAFEVSPVWFVLFLRGLDDICSPVDVGFKEAYPDMVLESTRTDWSPVHTEEKGVRLDRILIARVTSALSSCCSELAYAHEYELETEMQKRIRHPNPSASGRHQHECRYKFDVHPPYRSRSMWIHKDICRFHGDETRVAATQNITPVCVNDRVEIAVNLFNAKGMVDIKNIKWRPLRLESIGYRDCPLEDELMDWYDLDSFQSQSVEKLQIPDFFAPQLTHDSTEYAGIDVAVSRTQLVAAETGVVPQADRFLGSRLEVLPSDSPIILPLKRVGLQHDRFTKIQLRQGDTVRLYISQGGKLT